jgi:CHAT domain-containing protein
MNAKQAVLYAIATSLLFLFACFPSVASIGSNPLDQAQSDLSGGLSAYNAGDYAAAQEHFRAAYEALLRISGAEDSRTMNAQNDLAAADEELGDYATAETLYKDLYNKQTHITGVERKLVLRTLSNLAVVILKQGHAGQAEPLFRRTYEEERQLLGRDNDSTLKTLDNLCSALLQQGKYQEAEAMLQELYETRKGKYGEVNPATLTALSNLADAIGNEGRHADAEKLDEQLLAARQNVLRHDHPDTVAAAANLAMELEALKRFPEAESRLREAFAASVSRLGESHPESLQIRLSLARVLRSEGKFGDSAEIYRQTCTRLSQRTTLGWQETGETTARASDCFYRLALVLWDLQSRDQKSATALGSKAFEAAQRAAESGSVSSLSRNHAMALAQAAGVGAVAAQYEGALDDRKALEVRFAQTMSETERQTLSKNIRQLDTTIDGLASELARKAPSYWSYRSPEPTSVAALQGRNGASPVLLHANEALVLWSCRNDDNPGLVFAVAPDKFAWSSMGLSGTALADRVHRLRLELESGEAAATGSTPAPHTAFERETAHELYLSLLGDNSIRAVIANAGTLLFVPCSAVANLPPSLLVVSDPPGGLAGDGDPAMLRRTHWLIADKAVGMLPGVSDLAILRLRHAPTSNQGSEPLLAFADPDFRGESGVATSRSPQHASQSGEKWLASLQPLPGTRREAESLRAILNGTPENILLGSQASKKQLQRRQRDGSLAQVRVLDFATHGFLADEIPGIPEPSLALAATNSTTDASDDFLRASEISMLRLSADWVVLSACNTGRMYRSETQGLFGLAEAFFYAGARSLLVSHWRVRDDAAERLVTLTFADRRHDPNLNKAQALRKAMLQVMSDPSLDGSALTFADPSAWAPFAVVGDVD